MIDNFGRWYPDFPGQQPYQDPAYIRASAQYGMTAQAQPQPQSQGAATFTLPTRHADIIQVDSVEAIDRIPQAPGTAQMYMTKDELFIVIRDMLANGEHSDVIYDKRPPAPVVPALNPENYVLREDLPALVAELMRTQGGVRKNAKAEKNEEAE